MSEPEKKLLTQLTCRELKGVGPKLAERLEKCGILNWQDILFHLPYRYQDRTRITPIENIQHGDFVVVEGKIISCEITHGRKRSLVCQLKDATRTMTLRFFYFSMNQQEALLQADSVRCFGEARFVQQKLTMVHPEYQILNSDELACIETTLRPVYHSTEGLQQKTLFKLSTQVLNHIKETHCLRDYLPETIREDYALTPLLEALTYVHRPPADANVTLLEAGTHEMQQRLAFEELLTHQLALRLYRQHAQQHLALQLQCTGKLSQPFIASLPFQLTKAQQQALDDIMTDLSQAMPMSRLLQGDVGSGKTVVAALAALQAIEAGYQVAIMAPTEILAEQHYQTFSNWFSPLNIELAWLSGKLKTAERNKSLDAILIGKAKIAVGTHALFQKGIQFENLALIIIDEQHRFGVEQRLALREKGKSKDNHYPHQLLMSATPIPRTLAMTLYADMDISIIDEMPAGRIPINTVVIANTRRDEVIARIREACQQAKQVYWVCPLIEESELLEWQAAEKTAELLTNELPEARIGLIHGRLPSENKESIMQQFNNGSINLLVATTVIEVGVNVPNASLMIIENAERLGLSQLHQLRGRVGRGNIESHCVLLYQAPLSQRAKERLTTLRETTDGFEIARKDLELRGPGEILGTRQTGLPQMRIANLQRDYALLPKVQAAANTLLSKFPESVKLLLARWLPNAKTFIEV